MVRIAKTDVRSALRDILKDEMKKQQESELRERMDKAYSESYTDFCPYCKALIEVHGGDEGVHEETVKNKRYLVKKCGKCEKDVYVRIVMTPPVSMLDTPGFRGFFYTREYVYGEPENKQEESLQIRPRQKLRGGVWKG